MTDKDKKDLNFEIKYIFDSGANEMRIQEMVERFITKRGGLKSPTESTDEKKRWYKITLGFQGYGKAEDVEVKEFTPSELQSYLKDIKRMDAERHPMLDMWVKKVEDL
jgi:hypothetical protein